jgi:hypothetical protein
MVIVQAFGVLTKVVVPATVQAKKNEVKSREAMVLSVYVVLMATAPGAVRSEGTVSPEKEATLAPL